MASLSTRAIGRAAVREQLWALALPLFKFAGFDNVTFDDLATEAGVSRSTFLRYFGSKEDVVLFVFDPLGDAMAQALEVRPAAESDWVALRRSVDPAIDLLTRRRDDGLALLRLVWSTPALWARLHEKQAAWRPLLVDGLASRQGKRHTSNILLRTQVMAALGCLMVAFDTWVDGDGQPLETLTDMTFAALEPASLQRT